MKTLDQIISQYKSNTLDGRDLLRLVQFIPEDQLASLGIELKDEYIGKHEAEEMTEKAVLKQLEKDVAFGFEKALNQRGLSAGMMFEVVGMWNWVLENELVGFDDYAQYGLPLFRETALLYGFPNPIGDDEGWESKYETQW